MKLSAILAPLIAAKADHHTIMQVVVAFEEQQHDALERRRESDRKRQNEKRSRDITLCHSDGSLMRDRIAPVDVKQITNRTTKEEKKDRDADKPLSDLDAFKAELSPMLDDIRIDAICAVRKKKKAVFSAHAGNLLSKALQRCPDIIVAADAMILRNWTGIDPEWLSGGKGRNLGTPAPKPKSEFMQRQDSIKRELEEALGQFRDDDKFASTGPAFDLENANWRAH